MKSIWDLWQTAQLNPAFLTELNDICQTITNNWTTYKLVGDALAVPPYIIGCIHYREASFDFKTHLANGDPLWNSDGKPVPTVHVPHGLGPFDSWVSGAIGALKHEGWGPSYHWDLVDSLENLHSYNGWGPEKNYGVNSGYIWAGTNHYTSGMYVSDGNWDAQAIDKRPGCAAILLAFKDQGMALNEIPIAINEPVVLA